MESDLPELYLTLQQYKSVEDEMRSTTGWALFVTTQYEAPWNTTLLWGRFFLGRIIYRTSCSGSQTELWEERWRHWLPNTCARRRTRVYYGQRRQSGQRLVKYPGVWTGCVAQASKSLPIFKGHFRGIFLEIKAHFSQFWNFWKNGSMFGIGLFLLKIGAHV